ncbi:MAG: hypothetical protein BroJett040_07030 [Oligoflexia bacterium]|nr:MAG: hypothetical protein BroJett040_07030 [Oligoflexia bacterium]
MSHTIAFKKTVLIFIGIILISILLFLAAGVLTFVAAEDHRIHGFIDAIRQELVIGDTRSVNQKASSLVLSNDLLSFRIEGGSEISRKRNYFEFSVLDVELHHPVYSDVVNERGLVAKVIIKYSLLRGMIDGFIYWIIFCIGLFFVYPLIYRKVHQDVVNLERGKYNEQLLFIAKQVAHDIRSPLSALATIVHAESNLSVQTKQTLQMVVERINQIANDLLKKKPESSKEQSSSEQEKRENNSSHPLLDVTKVVDQIVQEKKLEYKNIPNFEITFNSQKNVSIPSRLTQADLGRILSNLINNSVESFTHDPRIVIDVFTRSGFAYLTVTDFGKGIPEDVLSKLGVEEISYGKSENLSSKSGSGIGVLSASKIIQAVGGELKLTSKLGSGTTAAIKLSVVI